MDWRRTACGPWASIPRHRIGWWRPRRRGACICWCPRPSPRTSRRRSPSRLDSLFSKPLGGSSMATATARMKEKKAKAGANANGSQPPVKIKKGSQDRIVRAKKLKPRFYEKELARLQVELVKLQEYVRVKGLKVAIV